MSKLCCITNIIRFMMKKAENLMKGSVHEDALFIVHDALMLMTAKETIKWMKKKNCLHRWLLPMNGLQNRTPYAGRHIGNCWGSTGQWFQVELGPFQVEVRRPRKVQST